MPECQKKTYELLCKIFAAVTKRSKDKPDQILERISWDFSDFETQKQRGSLDTEYDAVDGTDEIDRIRLEASGHLNWRSIMLTHDESPDATVCYIHCATLRVVIWDSGELLSVCLSDSSQPGTKKKSE